MPWSSSGTYTAPAAATDAFPGKVLASTDWNSIFTDIVSGINYRNGSWLLVHAAVDMNAIADTAITVTLPTGFTRYKIKQIMISHASTSLAAATQVQFGLFTATGGGGVGILTATACTVSATAENTANNAQFVTTLTVTPAVFNAATLYFRVTTAHGSAATADVGIEIEPVL